MLNRTIKKLSLVALTSLLLTSCVERRNSERYLDAYNNVLTVKEENIRPLVNITREDKLVRWNDNGEVLLFAMHNSLETFKEGNNITLEDEEIWLYSVEEMRDWYLINKMNTFNNTLRLKQILGMDQFSPKNLVSVLYLNPQDLHRPAFISDVTKAMSTSFADDETEEFKAWFRKTEEYCYNTNKIPWTRLGYSYDWGSEKDRYGLTEFVAFKGTTLHVYKTLSIDSFYSYLASL